MAGDTIADDLIETMTDMYALHLAGECDEDCEWCRDEDDDG